MSFVTQLLAKRLLCVLSQVKVSNKKIIKPVAVCLFTVIIQTDYDNSDDATNR